VNTGGALGGAPIESAVAAFAAVDDALDLGHTPHVAAWHKISKVCGSLTPVERRGGRCSTCGAQLPSRPDPDEGLAQTPDIPQRGGVVILAGLCGMSGALVGFVVAVVLVC